MPASGDRVGLMSTTDPVTGMLGPPDPSVVATEPEPIIIC